MNHLDFFDRPITIGDTVICKYLAAGSGTAHITIGTVTGFTPQKVKVHTLANSNALSFFDLATHRDEYKTASECIIANDLMANLQEQYPENFL